MLFVLCSKTNPQLLSTEDLLMLLGKLRIEIMVTATEYTDNTSTWFVGKQNVNNIVLATKCN